MKFETVGNDISKAEVLNVSQHGFWMFAAGKEHFLGFDDFCSTWNSLMANTSTGRNWTSTSIWSESSILNDSH